VKEYFIVGFAFLWLGTNLYLGSIARTLREISKKLDER